ncbi:hypothetical protein CORC01_00431 [Colletotrichum orchidophilum]|uniref:Uncharacterized protein n=1 Tax=Colletotrichum orchidophilum TaxID=1209926 RepID=A0A1G4BRL5_9PEZI|nr:uncharacterized protein CORC01_00431 [Colletotrichum orchidophilum]OHF04092.1 hypothetical protein CORC01_00431 [Colletotrichum orchidophilum]
MSPASCRFFKASMTSIRLGKGDSTTRKKKILVRVPPYPFALTPRDLDTVLGDAGAVETREGFHHPRVMCKDRIRCFH